MKQFFILLVLNHTNIIEPNNYLWNSENLIDKLHYKYSRGVTEIDLLTPRGGSKVSELKLIDKF